MKTFLDTKTNSNNLHRLHFSRRQSEVAFCPVNKKRPNNKRWGHKTDCMMTEKHKFIILSFQKFTRLPIIFVCAFDMTSFFSPMSSLRCHVYMISNYTLNVARPYFMSVFCVKVDPPPVFFTKPRSVAYIS